MPPRTRHHHPRPIVVIVVGATIAGCSSAVVREYNLIRSLVLPARQGDDSIIAADDSGTTHAGVGDDLGVQLHQTRTRLRSEQAIVLDPVLPAEPRR